MKQQRLNLAKLIKVFVIFFLTPYLALGQEVSHKVYFQLLGVETTNVSEVPVTENTKFYNLGYGLSINKFSFMLDKYKSSQHNPSQNKEIGDMESYTINSYSLLVGYNVLGKSKIKINSGLGIRYIHGNLAWYIASPPQIIDLIICHDNSRYGPVLWNNINLKIYKDFQLGLLTRYNPMLSNYDRKASDYPCDIVNRSHDRFNYFTNQLTLEYEF
jgi:hypothetical protein